MAGISNFGGKKATPFAKGGGRSKKASNGTAKELRKQAKKMVKDSFKGSKKDSDAKKLPPNKSKKDQARESLNFAHYEGLDIELSYVGFNALKSKLASQGASNPGALAAALGRRKYGKAGMAKLSGAGHDEGAKHTFDAKKVRAAHVKK